MDELAVGELHLAQREPYAVKRVVAEPARLGQRGAGGGERVPGARRGVGLPVLDRVQQVGEPPEEPAGLRERRGVLRLPREVGGVGEGGGGGGLGGFGDRQQRGAGSGERLDPGLPVDRVDQEGGVEAEGRPGPRTRPVPPGGDPARGGGDRAAGQQPVPVGDVVADLGRGEDERDGGGEPGPLALGDRRGAHGAQRAGACGATSAGGEARLSLRQDGDDEAVVVRHDTGELSVIRPQGQAETAEMGHPLDPETFGEAVGAGPDDSEHDDPPGAVQPVRDARAPGRRASYPAIRSPVRRQHHPYGSTHHIFFSQPPLCGTNPDESPHPLHQ